jgi:electron transport complex protein RnfE
MPLDGPTPTERFIRGILPENPVYRQVLGMCPTLAVTNGVAQALTMSAAVIFVMICANIVTSLIRGMLKPHLRILVFTLIIATFVTIADKFLEAYVYSMSKALGPYVPLIIVNCIIICRCEVCASKQGLLPATTDAIGQGIGFTLALLSLSIPREILGTGGIFMGTGLETRILPAAWPNWVVMVLPPGAFITFGLLMGLMNWISARFARPKQAAA